MREEARCEREGRMKEEGTDMKRQDRYKDEDDVNPRRGNKSSQTSRDRDVVRLFGLKRGVSSWSIWSTSSHSEQQLHTAAI